MKNRNSLYILRRKLQVIANKMTSHEFMAKLYYLIKFRKRLNIENPSLFSEKMHWLKLNYFPYNNKVIRCTDKYAVRDYLKEKGKGEYLNKIIGVWDKYEDIPLADLPNKFVLKCNHGCGYNIICNNKYKLNIKNVERNIRAWLSEDFGLFNAEPHYSSIPRRIICEEYLGDKISDYKFFCFHGEPKYFYIAKIFANEKSEKVTFFNIEGSRAPFQRTDYKVCGNNIKLPKNLNEMIKISKDLSSEFPFVRIDFFEVNDRVVFSEMTFTPGGGYLEINPKEYDKKLGDMLNLTSIRNI